MLNSRFVENVKWCPIRQVLALRPQNLAIGEAGQHVFTLERRGRSTQATCKKNNLGVPSNIIRVITIRSGVHKKNDKRQLALAVGTDIYHLLPSEKTKKTLLMGGGGCMDR